MLDKAKTKDLQLQSVSAMTEFVFQKEQNIVEGRKWWEPALFPCPTMFLPNQNSLEHKLLCHLQML